MLLLRWISAFEQRWLDKAMDSDLASVTLDSAPWVLSLFLPSEKDEGMLSVYEVADEGGAKRVAAALMMKAQADQRYAFIAVEKHAIATARVAIKITPGMTGHPNVDAQHRDLKISTISQAMTVAAAFIKGEVFSFEKNEVWPELQQEASGEHFDHLYLAKKGGNFYLPRLGRLLSEKTVHVRGKLTLHE